MPAPKRQTAAQLQRECDKWNAANTVGTLVSFENVTGDGETHRGKSVSEAQILSGHSAVIWLEGYSGCVLLSHCTAVADPATPVIRVTFGDYGQDFTEWYVRDGIVIDCQPHQGRVWVGTKVLNQATLCPKGIVAVISKATGEPTSVNYPVAAVETLAPKAAAEVEAFGRKWAEMMTMHPSDLGLELVAEGAQS